MGDNRICIGQVPEFYHINADNNTLKVFWALDERAKVKHNQPHTTAEEMTQFRQVCADVYRTVGFKPSV